jgi:Holliday junction resolvase RusA-like endonuclease
MSSSPTVIELPLTPVSYNETRFAPWYVTRAKSQPLRDALDLLLRTSDLPKRVELVVASAVLTFPTRRRRDEGNYRTPLEKALGDALTRNGFLKDDTPDQFRMERVVISDAPGDPLTELTLRWASRRDLT